MGNAYFQLGWQHILDINGFDHMLFIALLIAGTHEIRWKPILALVSCFTLGHTITLCITTLGQPLIDSDWVEFLIPITIIGMAAHNLLRAEQRIGIKLAVTVLFGLVHGMGFASYLQALLPKTEQLWKPLLYFNLGVEFGQILFAVGVILLLLLSQRVTKLTLSTVQMWISIVGLLISLFLAFQNWPLR